MISLYNLKKGGEARFSTGKFLFFGSGLIYGIYSHGYGGTRFLKYVCQIDTPYCTLYTDLTNKLSDPSSILMWTEMYICQICDSV